MNDAVAPSALLPELHAPASAASVGAATPVAAREHRPGPFGPGSVIWLLRHDLRVAGRGMRATSARKTKIVAAVAVFTVTLLHIVGFFGAPVLVLLPTLFRSDELLTGTIVLAGAFMLFLSKSMSEATDALYQRGDLDLLLSSPLPMRRVLITRLLAIAVLAGFMPLLLVIPVVDGMVLRGYFAWTGVYPALGGLSLTAASAGAAMTFGLLAWLGPRWTVFASRALATLFGALSFLLAQERFLVPGATRAAIWNALSPASPAGASSLAWWPARALLGEAGPMLAMALVGAGAVMAVSAALGQAYGAGVLGHLAAARRSRASGINRRFHRAPFGALLRKEALLLLRQPGLGAQLFYQFVFLAPGVVALMRVGAAGGVDTPAGVVFLTAMMTGRITKIIATGPYECDNAASLAATSPFPGVSVARAKLAVTSAMLIVVVGLSLAGIWLQMPSALPTAAFASILATLTRLRMVMGRPATLRRLGLQGRMPGHADGLLGVITDVSWGLFGAALSLAF